jgi:murein DD-endopeptidase MepM/ murein hydrolase activator NlpD
MESMIPGFAGRHFRTRRAKIIRAGVIAGIAAAALLAAFLAWRFIFEPRATAPPPGAAPVAAAETVPAPPPASPPESEEKITIPRGSNLAALLKEQGFDNKEIHRLKESVKPVYDLGRIRASREIRLAKTPDGRWTSLEYDIDDARYLLVRNRAGKIEAEIRAYPFEVRRALIWGTVETNLIAAVDKAGEESLLALDLVEECFGWDVDFVSDVRKGDTFKILFEKKHLDGRFAGYRNILAAEYVNEGTVHQAFRFTYPDTGVSDYFDENGDSKRREFLRSPFKFTPRITSRFSYSRFHPILKVWRPHFGVDYAAPIGTEVQATADGKVTFAGPNGEAGQMVRLQHKNHYETLYLHLGGFGPGIRAGAQVRSGQVVGYVGSSGESTGPHLDYRIYYNGTPINPLGQRFKPAEPLRKEFLDAYREEIGRLRAALDLPRTLGTAVVDVSF